MRERNGFKIFDVTDIFVEMWKECGYQQQRKAIKKFKSMLDKMSYKQQLEMNFNTDILSSWVEEINLEINGDRDESCDFLVNRGVTDAYSLASSPR